MLILYLHFSMLIINLHFSMLILKFIENLKLILSQQEPEDTEPAIKVQHKRQ